MPENENAPEWKGGMASKELIEQSHELFVVDGSAAHRPGWSPSVPIQPEERQRNHIGGPRGDL
jgi:hypothetical protein